MPVRELISRFLRYVTERFSGHTKRHYSAVLWGFADSMPDYIDQITVEHIERWASSLQVSNSSKNAHLTAIRSFFTFAESHYDITNIMPKVKSYKENPPHQRVLSEIEYRKILQVASENPIEHAVASFLGNTGLRSQEFCDLSPGCLGPMGKYISVIGKSRRRRVVPLNIAAKNALNIIFSKNYKFNNDKLRALCKRLQKRAKIKNAFGPHAFRHRFCTQLVKKGVPTSLAIKITGHSSSIVFEQVYVHLNLPSDVVGVTDVLD